MTSQHPVRRFLLRVCSTATIERVVDPVLADIRWETRRAHWRGYVSLAAALALHSITSFPAWIGSVSFEDRRAVPKIAALSIGVAVVGAIPLIAAPLSTVDAHDRVRQAGLALLLAPQALVLTLPAALLVTIPLALGSLAPGARIARRVLMLALVITVMTCGLAGWVLPETNQAFRVAVSGIRDVPRGPNERSLTQIRSDIETLRASQETGVRVRQLQYDHDLRLALSAAAVPLALLALACGFSALGRRRPVLLGLAALVIYLFVLFPCEWFVSGTLLRGTSVPTPALASVPNAVIVLLAGVITAARRKQLFVDARVP